jgi:hypothetical protein
MSVLRKESEMTKARTRDQFLYILLAVVFAAAATVTIWGWSESQKPKFENNKTQIIKSQTPDELMRELNQMVDDGGKSELESLKQDVNSL